MHVSHRSGIMRNATCWRGGERKARKRRTMSELRVPSSTTCVETIALPSNAQNSAATTPAWRAVKTTSAVDPCSRTAPVVRSCNGKETKYMSRKMRNSERPMEGNAVECSKDCQTQKVERDAPTAALLRVVMVMRVATKIMLRPQTIILAMFPSELLPALGIPHSGLTPTGSSVERPAKPVSIWFSSCK